MTTQDILKLCDNTLLAPSATWDDIRALCDDGMHFHTASVCIPASYVAQAKEYVGDRLPICTVIGFPNGYDTTAAKCFMASDAVHNGASEVDMVINIGWVKDKKFDAVEDEIRQVKAACEGKLLKVIVECCLLTDEEKVELCKIVMRSGADFIKTSTGFSTGGATLHDIKLFAEHIKAPVKIKASGGVNSFEEAEQYIALGTSRIGTSRLIRLAKQQ
ncbi:MAG: deoxyribose-phosphate aldolase [Eubacteriales bacterium]|nr:deoxyribose-phosphate aldolase [Eubacteriales bacterium]